VTHIHATETPLAAGPAAPAAVRRRPTFSLLGASAFARLAMVAGVSALLWLAILWALA
jgi:hypothetical protein